MLKPSQSVETSARSSPSKWGFKANLKNPILSNQASTDSIHGIDINDPSNYSMPYLFRVEISPKKNNAYPKKIIPILHNKTENIINAKRANRHIPIQIKIHKEQEIPNESSPNNKLPSINQLQIAPSVGDPKNLNNSKPIIKNVLEKKKEKKFRISRIGLIPQSLSNTQITKLKQMGELMSTPHKVVISGRECRAHRKRAMTVNKLRAPLFINKYMANNYMITNMLKKWVIAGECKQENSVESSKCSLQKESSVERAKEEKTFDKVNQIMTYSDFELRKLNCISRHMEVMAERRNEINSGLCDKQLYSSSFSSHSRIYSLVMK